MSTGSAGRSRPANSAAPRPAATRRTTDDSRSSRRCSGGRERARGPEADAGPGYGPSAAFSSPRDQWLQNASNSTLCPDLNEAFRSRVAEASDAYRANVERELLRLQVDLFRVERGGAGYEAIAAATKRLQASLAWSDPDRGLRVFLACGGMGACASRGARASAASYDPTHACSCDAPRLVPLRSRIAPSHGP